MTILFIILAAISNAIMDVLQFHFQESIFKNLNQQYWNPSIAWTNKYVNHIVEQGRVKIWGINVHPFFLDAWHLFKSLMIIFFICAIIFHSTYFLFSNSFLNDFVSLIYLGTIYNLTFSIFYNKLLLNKN